MYEAEIRIVSLLAVNILLSSNEFKKRKNIIDVIILCRHSKLCACVMFVNNENNPKRIIFKYIYIYKKKRTSL